MSVNIRYRSTKEGNYSAYLDIYHRGKRTYHYPEIYVSKDYTGMKNYLKEDREKIELVERMRDKIKLEIAIKDFIKQFIPGRYYKSSQK